MEKSEYINSLVVLGDGSFSTVYKGYDKRTGESVAIKKPKKFSQGKAHFRREIEILKKLPKHPNIIKVLDHAESDKNLYMILEYCQGESLMCYMKNNLENAFGVKANDFHKALLDITAGYKHLRDCKFAHRDIKPDNIMISYSSKDGSTTYKLADMGTAKQYTDHDSEAGNSATQLKSFVGSIDYMDTYMLGRYIDEQNRPKWKGKDKDAYSANIDLWSIGCTLVYIACNCAAFAAATPNDILDLHNVRKSDAIMGSNINGKKTFSNAFREVSPLRKTASLSLQAKYLNVIIECFKPLEERSADAFFESVGELRKRDLCYMINVNKGFGQYELSKDEICSTDAVSVFSMKSIDHLCLALKFPVCVRFTLTKDVGEKLRKPPLIIMPSDPYGKYIHVIKSRCSSIRIIVAQVQEPDFVIRMLKHLSLIVVDDKNFEKIQKDHIDPTDDVRNYIYTQYSEIEQIYKDMGKVKRTVELDSLQTRCGNIEKDLQGKLKEYGKAVYGKKQAIGLIEALSNAIINTDGIMKNTVVI